MRSGQALHLEYGPTARWWLTDGSQVFEHTAEIVITNPNIVSVDAALFVGMPAQTWRWIGA